jgi:V8-like Glu-specific endopeptidase
VEQPQARSIRRSLSSILVGFALAASAFAPACAPPRQRAVIAVPAARSQGIGRPVRLLPPFELVTTQDAVVRIVSDVTCTGTLIADDRVLTAHHCVSARDADGRVVDHDKAPSEIGIELGGDDLPWGEVTVRAIVAPKCGYASGDGDIAILVLSRHLIGIPTVNARIEAAPEKNDQLSLFGFGRCALTRGTIHRVARDASTVDAIAPGHFGALASICPGDSGGPVYSSKGDLIGVISASVMDGDDHTLGQSIFTRVDVWPQLFSAAHEISNGASPSELPPYGECSRPAAHSRRPESAAR